MSIQNCCLLQIASMMWVANACRQSPPATLIFHGLSIDGKTPAVALPLRTSIFPCGIHHSPSDPPASFPKLLPKLLCEWFNVMHAPQTFISPTVLAHQSEVWGHSIMTNHAPVDLHFCHLCQSLQHIFQCVLISALMLCSRPIFNASI